MNCSKENIELDGYCLRRYVFRPDAGVAVRGAAFHFHGQGDFSERYGEILRPFLQNGIACVATDLPGHGYSEGVRGRVPGFEIVDHIAGSNRERCRELCSDNQGPLGILGHSAGGLMALREMLQNPDLYAFSWISSPLLHPEATQNPLLALFARLGARLLPGLTVATGVTQDKCSRQPDPWRENGESCLIHARVSIGWGYAMTAAARWIREELKNAPPQLPLLITQGLCDPVCPPEYLHALLEEASLPHLTLHEFPEALHEPFADETREELFHQIASWLEDESIV